jgi:hypothetical protein
MPVHKLNVFSAAKLFKIRISAKMNRQLPLLCQEAYIVFKKTTNQPNIILDSIFTTTG